MRSVTFGGYYKVTEFFRLHEVYKHECGIAVCEPEGKALDGKYRRRRENNIKADMKDKIELL
jgi:hypothetical protein